MPQVVFTKSFPKLLVPKVLVDCVWMPAGEDQRMRLKVNAAWCLGVICQSTLGNQMFCSPVRGTGPSMVFKAVRSVSQSVPACAEVIPSLVASVLTFAVVF